MYKQASKNSQLRVERSGEGKKKKLNRDERKRLKMQRDSQDRKIINQVFRPGTLVRGKIIKIMDFGANVDVGGVWCFIHISEMSDKWIQHPQDIFKKNSTYGFKVIEVTWKKEKPSITLTAKF